MNGKVNISLERCRERRRRRIEMRRMSCDDTAYALSQRTTQWNGTNFNLNLGSKQIMFPRNTMMMPPPVLFRSPPVASSSKRRHAKLGPKSKIIPKEEAPPVSGVMSVSGRTRDMEDTVSIVSNLCKPEINKNRPVHFFGVFDGHGTTHVSTLCRESMHLLMEQELMGAGKTGMGGGGSGGSSSKVNNKGKGKGKGKEKEDDSEEKELWTKAIKRCFKRMDEMALSTCPCGNPGVNCTCKPLEAALSGSTAVLAMLTPDQMIVANCGDSRAVLCRAGKCTPLSSDHKPDRADELARIRASGGRVLYANGARVEGILAMSRALGDRYLKRVITSEPEICFMKRDPRDECLILASDGLWDVVSSRLACEIVSNCFKHGPVDGLGIGSSEAGWGLSFPSSSTSAATLLARLAMSRKSLDNVSVVVVDLRK